MGSRWSDHSETVPRKNFRNERAYDRWLSEEKIHNSKEGLDAQLFISGGLRELVKENNAKKVMSVYGVSSQRIGLYGATPEDIMSVSKESTRLVDKAYRSELKREGSAGIFTSVLLERIFGPLGNFETLMSGILPDSYVESEDF